MNRAGRLRPPHPHLFQGLIATKTSRGSPWDLGCDLGLRGDHPGSPTPDPPLVGRAEAGDDEVPVKDRAAPVHRLWAHSRAVFSRYATQLLDIPVAWANWGREKSRMLAKQALQIRSRCVVDCFHDRNLLFGDIERSISLRSVLSFLVGIYDVGKPSPLRGREVIQDAQRDYIAEQ